MIKSKGMELMELINQLGQIETIDTEITFAIFRSSTQKKMDFLYLCIFVIELDYFVVLQYFLFLCLQFF